MDKNKYEVIQLKKEIEPNKLFEDVIVFVVSHLNQCEVEKKVVGNSYTAIFYFRNQKNGKKAKIPYVTMEMIIQSSLCAVHFSYSKARPALNAVVAAAAAPIFLPVSGVLLGTAGLRLWRGNTLKNDVMSYIRTCTS